MTRHPHPLHEIYRADALDRLRDYYEGVCRERLGWSLPPRESFNHWVWRMQAQAAVVGRDGYSALPDPVLAIMPAPTADGPDAGATSAEASEAVSASATASSDARRSRTKVLASFVATPLKRQLLDVCDGRCANARCPGGVTVPAH